MTFSNDKNKIVISLFLGKEKRNKKQNCQPQHKFSKFSRTSSWGNQKQKHISFSEDTTPLIYNNSYKGDNLCHGRDIGTIWQAAILVWIR